MRGMAVVVMVMMMVVAGRKGRRCEEQDRSE
jgi:hypothetical protein